VAALACWLALDFVPEAPATWRDGSVPRKMSPARCSAPMRKMAQMAKVKKSPKAFSLSSLRRRALLPRPRTAPAGTQTGRRRRDRSLRRSGSGRMRQEDPVHLHPNRLQRKQWHIFVRLNSHQGTGRWSVQPGRGNPGRLAPHASRSLSTPYRRKCS